MLLFTWILLLTQGIETVDSSEFPRTLQIRAMTATVRIKNTTLKTEGSGVIVGRNSSVVYILTAQHVVKDANQLEVATFSEKSYPNENKIYREAKIVAKSGDLRDLALLRVATDDQMPGQLSIRSLSVPLEGNGFYALSCGCSEGRGPTCLIKKVTGKKRVGRKVGGEVATFWEWPEGGTRGRSGGPLVDRRGDLIGICSGTSDGKSYFSHTEEIHGFLKQNAFHWLLER